jgi:competence protein ComEC
MGVVQVAGLALLPAASAWPALGSVVGVAAMYGVRALLRSADVVAVAPWLVREVPPPSLGVLAVYYTALLVAATSAVTRMAAMRMLAMLTVAGCLVWIVRGGVEQSLPTPWTWPAAERWQRASWPAEPWLLITVLDVGQGDATVVRFPSGHTWLVDAGGSAVETFDTGQRVTSPALWALGHRRLDRVLITHAHPDHAAGMPTVIRRFAPREVLSGIPVEGDLRQDAVSAASRASSTRERPLATGESFADGAVHVSVLHPERPDWVRRRVRNDDSVVLWVRFGDVGVLLPGDIGQAVEARVASRIAAAPLTVVRLAHHGSASSTSHALLDALRPALAIGSMARGNRFGHPSAAVVRRLGDRRIPILRTDQAGAIQLATNGRVLLVRTTTGIEGSLMAGSPPRAWWLATPPPSDPASPRRAGGPPPRGAPRPTRTGG